MESSITIGVLLIWIICGVITAFMGSVKGRSGCGWFFAGFLLGPIGIIIAAVVKRVEPKVKVTIRHPYRPPMQETTPEQSNPQVSSEEKREHLQSLLKQATNLKDSDIDTAIRIVKQVVEEYEKNNEPFESIRPIYFKLAHYLQKKRDRDGAWKIYNKMLLDIMEEDPQFMGIYQGQIYSRMALLRGKEKAYKDAVRLRIQSYISTNTALHLQDRKEEVTPVRELHEQLRVLFKRGSMEYPERFLEKTLNPLVKKLRKKGPVREPFLETPKKNVKIKRQFGVLSKHTSEIIQEIQKEFSKLKQKSIGMEK